MRQLLGRPHLPHVDDRFVANSIDDLKSGGLSDESEWLNHYVSTSFLVMFCIGNFQFLGVMRDVHFKLCRFYSRTFLCTRVELLVEDDLVWLGFKHARRGRKCHLWLVSCP